MQLFKAVQNGTSEEVEKLLKGGADKEARDQDGSTPLHVAVYHGRRAVVGILLKASADKTAQNKKGEIPLHSATQHYRNEGALTDEAGSIVILLLEGDTYREQEDDSGNTPLSYALDWKLKKRAYYILPAIVQTLLVAGDGELTFALKSQNLLQQWGFKKDVFKHALETSKKLLPKHCHALCVILESQRIPRVLGTLISEYHENLDTRLLLFAEAASLNEELCKAAQVGNKEEVERLLQAGAYKDAVDSNSFTPLHYAARNGHKEVIRALVSADAHKSSVDGDYYTPLHLATLEGHEEVVSILLEAGAEKNAITRYHWTPLHWATEKGHAGIVKLLLQYKADTNIRNEDGITSLHWAVWEGYEAIVDMLLAAGAYENAVTAKRWTPLHMAAKRGHKEIVEILLILVLINV